MKKIFFEKRVLIGTLIGFFIGIFLSQARSGINNLNGSNNDTLTSTKWNQFISVLDSAIGRSGPDSLTAGSGDKLTTTKRNALVTKLNTYTNTPVCTNNNVGNCNINTTTKSAIDPNLTGANIKSGVVIFGVTGTLPGGIPLGPSGTRTSSDCAVAGGSVEYNSSLGYYVCKSSNASCPGGGWVATSYAYYVGNSCNGGQGCTNEPNSCSSSSGLFNYQPYCQYDIGPGCPAWGNCYSTKINQLCY